MSTAYQVKIVDPERRAESLAVLGTDTVCVRSPLPHLARVPIREFCQVYDMDLDELTEDQRERLLLHLCTKFDTTLDEGREELATMGVAVLAEGTQLLVAEEVDPLAQIVDQPRERLCEQCGKALNKRQARFCSRACYAQWQSYKFAADVAGYCWDRVDPAFADRDPYNDYEDDLDTPMDEDDDE